MGGFSWVLSRLQQGYALAIGVHTVCDWWLHVPVLVWLATYVAWPAWLSAAEKLQWCVVAADWFLTFVACLCFLCMETFELAAVPNPNPLLIGWLSLCNKCKRIRPIEEETGFENSVTGRPRKSPGKRGAWAQTPREYGELQWWCGALPIKKTSGSSQKINIKKHGEQEKHGRPIIHTDHSGEKKSICSAFPLHVELSFHS